MSRKKGEPHPYVLELEEQCRRGRIGRREFLRTATLLGVSTPVAYSTVMAGALAGLAPTAAATAATPKSGGVIRVAMRVQEVSDPAILDWPEKSNITRHVIEYLTITGPDNVTRPYLCERWQASDDLKTWDLYLRKNVKWSNGDMFNADDVVFNFRRWLDPATGSSNLSLFSALTEEVDAGKKDASGNPVKSRRMSSGAVEKVGEHHVRLHMNRAELAVPENLYNYPMGIVHRRFVEEGGDFTKNPVGTGAFTLDSYVVGEKASLRRRAPGEYWGGDAYLDGIDYIDLGEDASANLAALASDQVDILYETFVEQLEVAQQIPDAVLYETDTSQTGVARMQMDVKPFDDVRVRAAVCLCQDHQRLLDLAYRGRGKPAEDHHVASIHPDYAPMPKPVQDYGKAKKLLADAGYPDGIDLAIASKKDPPWEDAAVQALVEMCKPAGIRMKINVLPSAQFWENWDKVPFGFTPWTHRPLGVTLLNLGYRSGVAWNETHHNDPEFDSRLDMASAALDVDERRGHMAWLQKRLQDNAVIAQPLWRSVFASGHKRVRDFRLHPTLYHQFNKVWIDADA